MFSPMQFGSNGKICDTCVEVNRFESQPEGYLNSDILSFSSPARLMLEWYSSQRMLS